LAASMDAQNRRRLSDMGVTAMPPEMGVAALGRLLEHPRAQVGLFALDWATFFGYYRSSRDLPFFSDLAAEAGEPAPNEDESDVLGGGLANVAEPEERRRLVEADLRRIAARVLRLPIQNVDVDVPLVDLGMDSLMSTELFAQIERAFGQRLPLAALIEAPTVALLAGLVTPGDPDHTEPVPPEESREEPTPAPVADTSTPTSEVRTSWDSLVPIRATGSKRPIFLVHAEWGNVLFYRDLARHLDGERPVYGLQARGLDGSDIGEQDIREMAAHYIEAIREVQPVGPYALGGWCLGGAIAYEMACQLQAAGEEVDRVVMIQSGHRDYLLGARATIRQRLIDRQIDRWQYERHRLSALAPGERTSYLKRRTRRVWTKLEARLLDRIPAAGESGRSGANRYLLERLAQIHDRAFLRYEPPPYAGPVTIVRASNQPRGIEPDPTLGWGDLLSTPPELVAIDAYHLTIMEHPQAELLARALDATLDASDHADAGSES
jgi:thioesterase domain-containing protein/acyl carrier protein